MNNLGSYQGFVLLIDMDLPVGLCRFGPSGPEFDIDRLYIETAMLCNLWHERGIETRVEDLIPVFVHPSTVQKHLMPMAEYFNQ
jgi:hypothetical protein